jgi:O-antigen/teichoic acid export membrane protein
MTGVRMTFQREHATIMKPFLVNASRVFGANAFSLVIALAVNILYARYLGPAELGWYTLSIYLPEMAAIFLTLGLPISNVYLIGSGQVSGKEALANSLAIAAGLSFLAGVVYLFLLPSLRPTILHGMPLSLAALGTLALPLTLAVTHATSILQAKERLLEFSLVKAAQGLYYLAFILVFVVGLNLGCLGALLSYLLAGGVALSVTCWLLSSLVKLSVSLHGATLKKQLSYGLRGHLGNVLQFVNYRIDILMVAYFLTPREVGLYSLATLVGETLWHVANAAQTALFPRIASTQESVEVTLEVLTGVVAITVLGALLFLYLGRPLISLFFSQAFAESYGATAWLLPGIIFLCYGKILAVDLIGRGYAWGGTIGSAVALPFTLGLNPVLVPLWRIKGAAVTSSISYSITGLVLVVLFARACDVRYRAILSTISPWHWARLGLRTTGGWRRSTTLHTT